jgi:hypothetical protein
VRLLHNSGDFADLAEEEHALMSERDLAFQVAFASQMLLTARLLVEKMEHQT